MANILAELENMATNVTFADKDTGIGDQDITRWQSLFGFSTIQAKEHIENHRNDISRLRISDELWQMVQPKQMAAGFDREAYEYSLQRHMPKRPRVPHGSNSTVNRMYILKLETPLESVERVKLAAELSQTPQVFEGFGESGVAKFCKLDGSSRQKVLDWASRFHPAFRPTIIRLSMSPKDLNHVSIAPMLGVESTLPHHRLQDADYVPLPTQEQYPVWYFFYGNLARSAELQQRLDLQQPPEYTPARVKGAKIRSWRGQYKALVNSDEHHEVEGSAYLVQSKGDEDALRFR